MPSGGKKRKAQKKKKGRGANSHSTPNNQKGNGDLRTHGRKGSDVAETSSRKSEQDHRPIAEDEEQGQVDKKGKNSHPIASVVISDSRRMEVSQNGSSNGEAKSKQLEVQEEVEVVQDIEVTTELKPEESEVVKDIQVTRELKPDNDFDSRDVNIESIEGDAGISSSSSSSRVMESENMEEEKNGGLVMETIPDFYSAGKLVEEKTAVPDVDLAGELEEEKTAVPDVDLAGELEEEEKNDGSVREAAPVVDSGEPVVSLTEEVIQASRSNTDVDAGVSNGIGLASEDKEEISLPLSSETAGASDEIDSMATKKEDIILQSADDPIVESSGSGGAQLFQEPAIPESSENQPLLGSIPPPVERTSWKSCCGIFDVLRGSDR